MVQGDHNLCTNSMKYIFVPTFNEIKAVYTMATFYYGIRTTYAGSALEYAGSVPNEIREKLCVTVLRAIIDIYFKIKDVLT